MEARSVIKPHDRLAIYMEGAVGDPSGKMGYGVLRYSRNEIACVIDSHTAGGTLPTHLSPSGDVPIVSSVSKAKALGATVFVLGLAVSGGAIPDEWYGPIGEAVAGGMSIVNGLHDKLGPRYPGLPDGQWIWDIRQEPAGLPVASAAAGKLANRRLLLIGTDMAVGKMTAGLEIYAQAVAQGVSTGFVATGQIGMTITGAGVPLDAIRVDFAGGSIEREVLSHADKQLVIIEGQGSLLHPGSTANLPLLRGSMPTHLVLCCVAGEETLYRAPEIRIPSLDKLVRLNEDLAEACGVYGRPKCVAIAVNGSHVSSAEAAEYKRRVSGETGLPAFDPIADGAAGLLAAVMA